MISLIILLLLMIFLHSSLNRLLSLKLRRIEKGFERLQLDYVSLENKLELLRNENDYWEKSAEETIALYDITKDICKSLDEEKVFATFKEKMQRYVVVDDCKFLRPEDNILKYPNYTIFPLSAYKKTIGFLAVSGMKAEDSDKFNILAQQFLLGIKRALLYKEVQELTITDSLTHVFTRRYFMERFNEELIRSKKFKQKFSFLMIDIDRFKDFNDRYGHLVGDAILREVTKTVKEAIRQIDLIGRYGGEEISIILTKTEIKQARVVAERIRSAIEKMEIRAYDEDLKTTISIGIAAYPQDAFDAKSLIEKADEALYSAKESGRNKVCTYSARQ